MGLSAAALGERPSPEQLGGVALILAGVLIAVAGRTRLDRAPLSADAGPGDQADAGLGG